MKEFLKQNWFNLGILLVAIIIALSLLFYLVILPAQKEKNRHQEELSQQSNELLQSLNARNKQEEDEQNRKTCLLVAESSYVSDWNTNCKTSGINKKTDDCTLPMALANSIGDALKEAKDECYRQYPVQ